MSAAYECIRIIRQFLYSAYTHLPKVSCRLYRIKKQRVMSSSTIRTHADTNKLDRVANSLMKYTIRTAVNTFIQAISLTID